MNAAILLVAALATGDAPAPPVDTSFDSVTQLQGTWEVVEVTIDGKDDTPRFKGDLWTFAGDSVKFPGGTSRIVVGTTRLDRLAGSGKVVDTGVYRVAGNELVWTFSEDAFARFTFRRVRE
jgi:hypothetical protein